MYSCFIFIWLYGILPFFQSPDIITSHTPLSNTTKPSQGLPLSLLLPPVPSSITYPSSVRPSGPVCTSVVERVRCPLHFVWTASSSSKVIEKAENSPEHLKPPSVWCQAMREGQCDYCRVQPHTSVPIQSRLCETHGVCPYQNIL